ncbi:MAG: hypothetical protein CVU26_07690 [Betaproteobacteria bacterium HGW-Betaproteobacteria-2]|jgi:hypothetical protein|nr:MAG: hypothetical protein CVU26_07690 [Betaproteobacteria bacterium HGW-Betaproteobacteria-2]
MYIVAIAWLYVTLLMAFTESSFTAGILTFLFYGLLPCALFIWIVGTPQRRRNRLRAAQCADEQQTSLQNQLDQPDGSNPQRD